MYAPGDVVERVPPCLVLVLSCNGWEITTVEGVGNRLDGYSDVQKRLVAFNGSQCGYCTPGWIMHLTSLVDKNLNMSELEESFGSNTCRCTGFRPILDTIKSFAIDASPEICQKVRGIEELNGCSKNPRNCQRKCSSNSDCSDWSVVADVKKGGPMRFDYGKHKFFKVYEIEDIFDIFRKYGVDSYMLVDGNTAKDISEVMALKTYDYDQNLVLGANVSLEDCIKIFKEASAKKSEFAYLAELIGSIAGNLMYKHKLPRYKSDLFLLFECIGATVTILEYWFYIAKSEVHLSL
ncbi:hypothetical protein HF086_008981 [Spodoptera exigua]|uniref:[2Fe-2S]-binding domain-containing protein n=1 Tax=Spodoptera exigua TaxID=7107 RepID=A0A922MQX2_SPOEX|nr:hypothetical protein HF086_008981 [Spodoptera exigua]